MSKMESVKRIVALHMDILGTLLQLAAYAVLWFKVLYPILSAPRYTLEGYPLGEGLKLYYYGHMLVLLIYFILLVFFTRTYGGMQIGYLRVGEVFFSQIFALLMVNLLTYFQLSLMRNRLLNVRWMLLLTLVQLLIAFLFTWFANAVYVKIFPARKLLVVSGEYPADDIIGKFESRRERYEVVKTMNISEGVDAVEVAAGEGYSGVVLWDIPTADRNRLLKHCYANGIRVYVSPKIPDVLIAGAEKMHLFDTPIYMVREYAIKTEERMLKRCIDVVLSLILIVLTSPLMLVTAIVTKAYDGGPVLYKQTRCTLNGARFQIMKFRSMRTDAEKDGVARLATVNDARITPFGKFIRRVRIDELPQLFNILKGEMSFVGPRPERPEIIAQYLESMPEFRYRLKVKAGLAGYAQIYGKYNTTPYDKLKLDLTYIENYSVWLDLKLMLLTLKILFTPDATEGVEETQITAMKPEKDTDADRSVTHGTAE